MIDPFTATVTATATSSAITHGLRALNGAANIYTKAQQMEQGARHLEIQQAQAELQNIRLMSENIRHQQNLGMQAWQREEDRGLQKKIARKNREAMARENALTRRHQEEMAEDRREFLAYENSLNRSLQESMNRDNLAMQAYQQEANRNQQADLARQNIAAQAQQGDLNRQHQAELAYYQREFQAHENLLSRQLQENLAELSRAHQAYENSLGREFQAQQGELARALTEKVEIFRADLQKHLLQRQRELQLEIKTMDIELARELRQFDRATALEVITAQSREKNSPIWPVMQDLLHQNTGQSLLPIHIFFSPPHLRYDQTREVPESKGFPLVEQYLQGELRTFFARYEENNRPLHYLAGAWNSKRFNSEAAARQIFSGFKTEPTMIIESAIEGENLSINFAYWGLNYAKERYFTAVSFSWLEALYDVAKTRTRIWFERRKGRSEAELIEECRDEKLVRRYLNNQEMMERERLCIERGEDLRELVRDYYIAPKDYDELKGYIAVCHQIFAGLLIDEYFLLDVSPSERRSPMLPLLLPDLLEGMAIKDHLIESIVTNYDRLYQRLLREVPDWEPELRLELAISLAKLPSLPAARAQIDRSIRAWLALRQVNCAEDEDLLALLNDRVTLADRDYVQWLHEAWAAVGIDSRVDIGWAFYRQGRYYYDRHNYVAAVANFDRAIALGVTAAIDAKENALKARVAAQQQQVEAEKLQQAQEAQRLEEEKRQQEAEALRQARETERLRQLEEAKRQQEAEALRQARVRRLEEEKRQREAEAQEAERLRRLEEEKLGETFTFETFLPDPKSQSMGWGRKEVPCLSFDLGNGVPLEMVYVLGGSFLMGAPAGEPDSQDDERPQHQVKLQAFYMGKYQITQRQYQAVMGNNPSNFKGDNLPVEMVSWHDAVAFCQKLSKRTGQYFWLPTEAQWEYACRAGTTTPYYFGSALGIDLANFGNNHKQTTDVGSFLPNAFGLYDMHGNVWEWCRDPWHENYQGAPIDGNAWLDGGNSNYVLRGCSWYFNPYDCRSAYRFYYSPADRCNYFGFRVVAVAAPSTPHRQNC